MAHTATYVQAGEAIDYLNTGTETIGVNEVVAIGKHIGIAGTVIEPGGLGSLHLVGVFDIPKKAGEEIAIGDDVVYTPEDGIAKAADGETAVGYAIEASAADDPTAFIRIG